jgi:aminoglycoside 6'-N-acetyltransferase
MIAFEPLRREDLPLLADWLRRPHVQAWWREPDASLAHYEDALAGRDPTDNYLILVDGRSVGMIQTYLVSDYPEWESVVQVGEGVAGIDLLIGEEELLGRGLGVEVLEQFTREVVFARPETHSCVASVAESNRRSWRAFEKAGFRHERDVEEEGKPHRLMRLERG